jgi:hypothetical protein
VIRAQRFAARAALSGTVFLAGWVAGWLAGFDSPGNENIHAAPIEDRGSPRGAISVTADREPVDAPQATAITSVANVATAVLRLAERTVVSAAVPVVADVATADPASPEPAVVPASVFVADVLTDDPVPANFAIASAAVSATSKATTADLAPPVLAAAPAALSDGQVATAVSLPGEPAFLLAGATAAAVPVAEAPLPESHPAPPPETSVQLASLFTSDPLKESPKPAVRPVETPNECLVAEICIDEYLWSLYERTPKIDTNKVTERIKVKVKKKGKTRTVIKTTTKYVVGDFTWKDPIAAQRAGMSLKDYVIGGMDRGFKLKLYRALRAMDDAGLMPGITSAFRDDYRQSIVSGNKATSDSSYHGGSRRGGYGHGLAADVVSVKGETRMQRYASSAELWKWIDAHEKELGIGRPYLDRDPPHVGPIDGKEYAAKRGLADGQKAGLHKKKGHRLAVRKYPGLTKRAKSGKIVEGEQPPTRINNSRAGERTTLR